MFKRKTSLVTLLMAFSMLLTACGGATDTPTSVPVATTAPAAAATDTTAPAAATPTVAAADTPTTAAAAPKGSKIAILLPETKTARYESQDLPLFKAKLQALG